MNDRHPCGCPLYAHPAGWPGVKAPAGLIECLVTEDMRKAAAAAERRRKRAQVAKIRRAQIAAHFAKKASRVGGGS